MGALKTRFQEIADRVDAMSVRERGLIFVAVMVVLYLISYNIVFGPLRAEEARLQQELSAKRQQIQAADQQVSQLLSPKDASAESRNKIASLTKQLQELDMQMDRMTAGVVNPKEMAKLIEQMLAQNKHLELVKLEALPATPLDEEGKVQVSSSAAASAGVYRHGMRIELKGRYLDILEYLKTLEGLQWKVFWGAVSLESDKYPVSKVTLVIYTLSRHPAWIGV